MTKPIRWLCVSAAAISVMLLVLADSNRAQDKAPLKHDAKVLSDSLREVINVGAKMFNEQGDYAGCYRLYQGSLLSVRPFVAADLQRRIDDGISNAERMGSYADRAFELRKVLDDIRAAAKPAGKNDEAKDKKQEAKKEEVKEKKEEAKEKKEEVKEKKDEVKKEEKKAEPAAAKAKVTGTVAYEGKPITGGYSVTFIDKEKKKHTSPIQKDGTFQFAAPIPVGEYQVAIEPIADEKAKVVLPPRYASAETSSLVVIVNAEKNVIELNLVK